MYLETHEKLARFVNQNTGTPVLAIDTEFLREKTYYPKLCLLQLATEKRCVVVDPLVINDLSPLVTLFSDVRTTKVFHAGEQDCAIIHNRFGLVPTPLFDTQKAASILGFSQQVGLASIVSRYCGVTLAKHGTFSDWQRRPLTPKQVAYALDDVRYLPRIYRAMTEELEQSGRALWLSDEFARLADAATYAVDPDESWRKVKGSSVLPARQLSLLQPLAAWRERTAQGRNCPRRWFLTDEQLVEISRHDPETVEALFEIRGIREKLGLKGATAVVELLAAAREAPQGEQPRRERRPIKTSDQVASLDLMTALVHLRAAENRISSSMLTNHDELVRIASGEREDVALLSGWRREIVGAEIIDLLEGRIVLHLKDGELKVTAIARLAEGGFS
ncbi:MAG: ribonuclease D [Coriobacteriales bacterium]|nr:ribonuclease D [Coriobacteriales bacterium]